MGQKVCRATSIFVTSSRCLFLPFCLYLRGAAFRASRCYHSRVVKSSPLQSSSNYPRLQCTMAESLLDQQLRNRNDPFTLVSPELITNVICQLPSLFDALVFSATCRRHRQIYCENVTHIYTHIAPKTITCRRDARNLLADQGGAAPDSRVLSMHDVSQLLRNSRRVEKAIDQFNRDIVCRVRNSKTS